MFDWPIPEQKQGLLKMIVYFKAESYMDVHIQELSKMPPERFWNYSTAQETFPRTSEVLTHFSYSILEFGQSKLDWPMHPQKDLKHMSSLFPSTEIIIILAKTTVILAL